MKDWWKLILCVIGGFLGGGLILLAAKPPEGVPVALMPPPTLQPVMVQVAGAVARPGVYRLDHGCRVVEALEAAGGMVPLADRQEVNLAALVKDGERIFIPSQAPTPQPTRLRSLSSTPTDARAASPTRTPFSGKININTASAQQLEALPGIGPVLAKAIVDYRQEHGPYKTVEALLDVPGIGPKTLERIQDLVSV